MTNSCPTYLRILMVVGNSSPWVGGVAAGGTLAALAARSRLHAGKADRPVVRQLRTVAAGDDRRDPEFDRRHYCRDDRVRRNQLLRLSPIPIVNFRLPTSSDWLRDHRTLVIAYEVAVRHRADRLGDLPRQQSRSRLNREADGVCVLQRDRAQRAVSRRRIRGCRVTPLPIITLAM